MRIAAVSLVALAGLTACAGEVTIKPARPNVVETGVPWNLPMTQFHITIKWELQGCDTGRGKTPQVKVTATATSRAVVDPSQRYVLNNPGWLSSGKIESELSPSGFSNGLTSEVNDETGAFLVAAAKVVGGVLSASRFDGARQSDVKQRDAPGLECTTAAAKAVATRKSVQLQLDAATKALRSKTSLVTQLTAVTGKGDDKTDLRKALADQASATDGVDILAADLVEASTMASGSLEVDWPERGTEHELATPWAVPANVYAKWFQPKEPDWTNFANELRVGAAMYASVAGSTCWTKIGEHAAQAAARGKNPKTVVRGTAVTTNGLEAVAQPDGLPVRIAEDAALIVAKHPVHLRCVNPDRGSTAETEDVALIARASVLQAGLMYYVPMRGRAFHSETATVKTDDAGNPTSIHAGQTNAAAVTAASSVGDVVGALSGIESARRAGKLADTKERTDQYNADALLAAAQATADLAKPKADADAQKSLADAKLAKLQSDTALANALHATSGQ